MSGVSSRTESCPLGTGSPQILYMLMPDSECQSVMQTHQDTPQDLLHPAVIATLSLHHFSFLCALQTLQMTRKYYFLMNIFVFCISKSLLLLVICFVGLEVIWALLLIKGQHLNWLFLCIVLIDYQSNGIERSKILLELSMQDPNFHSFYDCKTQLQSMCRISLWLFLRR